MHRKRILICTVIDVEGNVQKFLERDGFEATACSNPDEALKVFIAAGRGEQPFEAVFTEFPKLVQNIRESPFARTPIVYRGRNQGVLANQCLPNSATVLTVASALRALLSEYGKFDHPGGGGPTIRR